MSGHCRTNDLETDMSSSSSFNAVDDGSHFAILQQRDLFGVDFGSIGFCSASTDASTVTPPTPISSLNRSPTDGSFIARPALESGRNARQYSMQSYFDSMPGDASIVDASMRMESTVFHKARRREQNRIAQRAFRERKEYQAKQLEDSIAELRAEHRALQKKYDQLRDAHSRLQAGIKVLLQSTCVALEEERPREPSVASDEG